jgi:hypothetical protein
MNKVVFLAALLPLAFSPRYSSTAEAPSPQKPQGKTPCDGLDRYVKQHLEGWEVLVNKRLLGGEHQGLRARTLKLLGDHLYRITRVVPSRALARLRKVPIWVELAHPRHPCMCYHPSAGWLRDHGMNPKKAGAVEIANCKNFLAWTRDQPWMVLHELAHAYHHQVLGFEHAGVLACFKRAVASKSYEAVLHIGGRKRRAYALTNAKEYFAELSEAYFGTNDFYPFVRAELKQHDPKMFELLGKLWGGKASRSD